MNRRQWRVVCLNVSLQDAYLASAEHYAHITDLAKRVSDWENKILPKLNEEVSSIAAKRDNTFKVACSHLLTNIPFLVAGHT